MKLLAATTLALVVAAASQAGDEPSVEGDTLAFRAHDLEGGVVTSEDERFRGKLVLVDLWGSWCPPCLTEIPTFNEMQSRYAEDGLVVVGMAFERIRDPEKRRAQLRAVVEKKEIPYLVLDGGHLDEFEATLPAMRNVGGFPIEILIDPDGKVVDVRNGYGYRKRWARGLEHRIREGLGLPAQP